MLSRLLGWVGVGGSEAVLPARSLVHSPPTLMCVDEIHTDFDLRAHLMTPVESAQGQSTLPMPDWRAMREWVRSQSQGPDRKRLRAAAWHRCERAWLELMQESLGEGYRIEARDGVMLLSALEAAEVDEFFEFQDCAARRLPKLLAGLVKGTRRYRFSFVVFDAAADAQMWIRQYGQYSDFEAPVTDALLPVHGAKSLSAAIHALDREASQAPSSGERLHEQLPALAYLPAGRGHFVCSAETLDEIQSMIVHQMTHLSLAHLPMPLWIDEGIALNTQERLRPASAQDVEARRQRSAAKKSAVPADPLTVFPQAPAESRERERRIEAHELRKRHRAHWNSDNIQRFWSGESFQAGAIDRVLSWDLSRMLVAEYARDWDRFAAFARRAHHQDAGAQAARETLGFCLGKALTTLLGGGRTEDWAPDPARWTLDREAVRQQRRFVEDTLIDTTAG